MALNDINQMFSIVDPRSGKPTDYLIRLLRDRGVETGDLVTTVTNLSEQVNSIDGTTFTAGEGLTGGGVLGTDDPISFDLDASLNQISDVDLDTVAPSDESVLSYDLASGNWVPSVIADTENMIAGFMVAPQNQTYKLVVKIAHDGTIHETTTICATGTATATFQINGVALGGTANSVSTTEQSQAHTSSNTFVAGDDIEVVISASASIADMSFNIRYDRSN